jgi:tRNA-dihydrouridine synthase B
MTTELANTLNKSLSIGNRSIAKRLVLAPMAFVGNIAFRELLEKFGGYGLLFTEMCSGTRSSAIWFVRFLELILL